MKVDQFVDPSLTVYAVTQQYPDAVLADGGPLHRESELRRVQALRTLVLQLQPNIEPPALTAEPESTPE